MIQTSSDMKMVDMVLKIESSVKISGRSIRIEGGLVDLKRFRDLVFLKCTLKHTFLSPSKERGYWTLIVYPATPEEFEEIRNVGIKWIRVCLTTIIILGVVWLSIW